MKTTIIIKLIKNFAIIGFALILTVFCLGLTGCKQLEEPKNNEQTEEQQLNVDALEKEYNAMIGLAENILFKLSEHEGEMTVQQALDILQYVQENRIKPTQELTIALDNALDDLIELLIKHQLASEAEKAEVEARIIELLEQMDSISIEIEEILATYEQF